MKKITQAQLIEFLRNELETNYIWAERALLRIYQNQTELEKSVGTTYNRNNIGFTPADSRFLSNVAKYTVACGKHLSTKQRVYVMPKMAKYARQLFKQAYFDRVKLETLYMIKHNVVIEGM